MTNKDENEMSLEEALEEVNASLIALNAAVKSCEDCREFMSVARLAIKNQNPELAETILTVMIDRLDPFLQNYYKDVSDSEFVDKVKEKMETKGPWPEELVEFIEMDDSLKDLANKERQENDEK